MSTRSTVLAEIRDVAAEQSKSLAPLSDSLLLMESGLDSLCFAILVARLEDKLGVDPFTTSESERFPTTIGDLIAFYDSVVA